MTVPDLLLNDGDVGLRETVRGFTRSEILPVAASFDAAGEAPEHIYRAFFETGLLHGFIPRCHGGQGHTTRTTTVVAEELAFGCLSIASALVVGILPISIVLLGGSERQKESLLRPLSERFSLPAIACTELGVGSDLRATGTRAVWSGNEYRITGEKAYVSNLPFADFVIVIARTEPGERLGSGRSLSAFAVPRDSPGLVPGPRWRTLGLRSLGVCSLSLHEVPVSPTARIGAEGDGLSLLNRALDLSRVMMASYGVGACQRVISELFHDGRRRDAGGRKPSRAQSYRFGLVEMEEDVAAAQALSWVAAVRHDAGLPYTREASIAKLHAGRVSRRVADRAGMLLGGRQSRVAALVEKFQREAPALTIIEGGEAIQKEVIYADLLRRSKA